jgi:hypothetical protein
MQTFTQEEEYPLALRESFLSVLEGSVGTSMFRTLYRQLDDRIDDVIDDGDLACAFYASTILSMFGLTDGGVHTTVSVTLDDMHASGWVEVDSPEAFAVVLWGEKMGDDKRPHYHIGFCVNEMEAIEHSAVTKSPRKIGINDLYLHDGSKRPPIGYFVHPRLCIGA